MSYIPSHHLTGLNLIVQFVVEYRSSGHFLPYDDQRVIEEWLDACEGPETLLLVLSDLIPDFYQKAKASKHPPSLSRIRKKVLNLLDAKSQRHP